MPSAAFTVVSAFAVYVVPLVSAALGVSVAVVHGVLQATVAATALPPLGVSVTDELVSVSGSIVRENVSVGVTFVATLVAVSAGDVLVTVGGGDAPWIVHV
jgi:hypothetical protein